YTLAVDHTGSRARLPLSCLAALHIQCVMHPLDRAVIIPAGQIVVHRALWGQVLGQIAPLAAGAQHIHHTVHHFSHHHRAVAPTMFGWWDLRLDQRPLLIGQVRWVAQLVAVVAGAVLGRPHPAPLAKQAPWTESQVIRAAQAQPATDSNDSHSFRTDTEIGDFTRFRNPRHLMAYVGLVPSEHSSGNSVRRSGITKAGNSQARRALIEGRLDLPHASAGQLQAARSP